MDRTEWTLVLKRIEGKIARGEVGFECRKYVPGIDHGVEGAAS